MVDDVELLFMMQKKNGDYIDFCRYCRQRKPIKQMQPHVIVRPRKNLFPGINMSSYLYYFDELGHFAEYVFHLGLV